MTPAQYCHQEQNFLTQMKFVGVYTVPKLGVQVSGTFQSSPGVQISAIWVVPNAQVAPALGRSLSASATTFTTNLVNPGTMYSERLNQLDLRFAKIVRLATTRTSLNFDLYNALNRSTVLQQNSAYASWLTPSQILVPRFMKLSATFDF